MAEKTVLVNICRAPFGTVFYTEGLRAGVGVSAGIDENILVNDRAVIIPVQQCFQFAKSRQSPVFGPEQTRFIDLVYIIERITFGIETVPAIRHTFSR